MKNSQCHSWCQKGGAQLHKRSTQYAVRCTKKGPAQALRTRGGFTMAEILIALTILTIGLVSILSLFPVGLKASRRAGDLNEATLCAQEILDGLKLCDYDDPSLLSGGPHTASHIEQIPGVSTNWYANYIAHSGYVVANVAGYTNLKQIDLTIRWIDAGRTNEEGFVTYRADYE